MGSNLEIDRCHRIWPRKTKQAEIGTDHAPLCADFTDLRITTYFK